jgi:hypothetical protein
MIFVRNLKTPTFSSKNAHALVMYYKEFLLLSGYTVASESADAAFSTCITLVRAAGVGGFEVNSANPRIIYDPGGGFIPTHQTNEAAIALYGTLGKNRSMYRILNYIDANHVEIDPDGEPPGGWVTETQMAGRVLDMKAATLSSGSYTLLQAPIGNLQVRLLDYNSQYLEAFVRPKGGAGTATEVPSAGVNIGYTSHTFLRMNAVLDGKNAVMMETGDGSASYNGIVFVGELDDVVLADTDPGFIQTYGNIAYASAWPWTWPMYMLNGAGSPAQITAYPMVLKRAGGNNTTTDSYAYLPGAKLENGLPGHLILRKLPVALDNTITVGACRRGTMPIVRICNLSMERYRPIDTLGNWIHWAQGFVLPRNGEYDRLPIIAYGG